MAFVYVVTIYIFEFHFMKFLNFGPMLSKATHTTAKWLGTPLNRIQLQIKTFAFTHLRVKYGSLLWLDLIEVWLKHSGMLQDDLTS